MTEQAPGAPDGSSEASTLQKVVDEYLELQRRGMPPTVDEYAARHPHLAPRIRELLSAAAVLERLLVNSPGHGVSTRDAEPAAPTRELGGAETAERLGGYRVLRELGRGGMGVVFEAVEEKLERRVALKVLTCQPWTDARLLERFRREAQAAARLDHPHIVPVYAIGEAPGLAFYAMKYVEGRSLDLVLGEVRRISSARGSAAPQEAGDPLSISSSAADALATSVAVRLLGGDGAAQTLPPQAVSPVISRPELRAPAGQWPVLSREYFIAVARIGQQAAEALAYAHAHGVLHRDVKPSNLLLDLDCAVWVTDFGLARLGDKDAITRTGELVGTFRYMPPERFEGRADERGDIYSLGLTIQELLTLRPAFEDDGAGRDVLLKRVITEQAPSPRCHCPGIPLDLEAILCKAIDRDPDRRYSSAAELAADLQRFIAGEPVAAALPRISAAAGTAKRRRIALAAGLAAVLAALSASAAYWLLPDGRSVTVLEVGSGPNHVIACDVNGDGRIDLVTADSLAHTASVVLNAGAGRFRGPVAYATDPTPTCVAAADLDGNGSNDLVVVNQNSRSLSLLFNQGSGIFAPAAPLPVGERVFYVAAADVDGDGRADLATTQGDVSVVLWPNRAGDGGGASFAAGQRLEVGRFPNVLVAVDLDRDGAVDLLVASRNTDGRQISILWGQGGGAFGAAVHVDAGETASALASADLDGDGNEDIAGTGDSTGRIWVVWHSGSRHLELTKLDVLAPVQSIASADFDLDGDLDLAGAGGRNDVCLLSNDGERTLRQAGHLSALRQPSAVAAADLDQDGAPDLVVTNFGSYPADPDHRLSVFFRVGSALKSSPSP